MLINLSNHPKSEWGEMQVNAAEKLWGEIVDVAFPRIDPTDSSDEVAALAECYFQKIRKMIPLPIEHSAIHLMGELNFSYTLINLLISSGYKVVASTTVRIARTLPNGKTERDFIFEQFREYKKY